MVEHVATVLAIEVLCAAQALDLLKPLKGGKGVEAARACLRRRIAGLGKDRRLDQDIDRARRLVQDESLRHAAERAAGKLV